MLLLVLLELIILLLEHEFLASLGAELVDLQGFGLQVGGYGLGLLLLVHELAE